MTRKKTITLIALFLLAFHFTFTLIYNSPLSISFVNNYMQPVFEQNWKFFAPDPSIESRTLFFRYKSDDNSSWSTWINPGKKSQAIFDYNRFSYHGKLVHLNATICHYLSIETKELMKKDDYLKLRGKEKISFFNKKIIKTGSFYLAKSYIKNWILWKYGSDVNQLQLVFSTKNNKTNKTAYNFFPVLKYEEI